MRTELMTAIRQLFVAAVALGASDWTLAQRSVPLVLLNGSAPVGTQSLPGGNRAILPTVTPAQWEIAESSRALPSGLNKMPAPTGGKASGTSAVTSGAATVSALRVSGDSAAASPASIAELARALKNDPDRIYEYVRNNIEFYPLWGIKKGAFGALLDNQGTSFDQAALMVALLRQAGYTASFVKGQINLTAAQFRDWMGVDVNNICGVSRLLGMSQIPVAGLSVSGSTMPSCPASPVPLGGAKLQHVWVKAVIGGTAYYFDPSFKPHTIKIGVDLATASGYNASTYLSAAKSGATVTADYVQSINRTGIVNNLNSYASNLTSWIRTNKPAADLDDIVGGKTITPYTGANLRQATLPYQDTSVAVTEWTDIPNTSKPTLRIQYSGIDQTYTSDAIYGHRLTLTYNGSMQPVLSLDGASVAVGTAVTSGSMGGVTFSVVHPYAITGANQTFTQQIKAGGTYLIGNGWGSGGRGPVEFHRKNLEAAKASGATDASESVLGSSLAMLSASWIAQVNQGDYILDRLAKTNTVFHHQIGIAGYNNAPYVDLPGNMVSMASESANAAAETAVFYSSIMHSSVLESVAVQQTAGVSAVSTVKLIDMAAAAGDKIFNATSANFASVVQPSLVGCSGALSSLQNAVAAGRRLILPTRCNITENTWSGTGYFDIGTNSIGAIISGGLAGGFSTQQWTTAATAINAAANVADPKNLAQGSGAAIDVAKGSYTYTREDLKAGVGDFPFSLSFSKLYSSAGRSRTGPLGLGWTHNFAAAVAEGSDGLQALGEDSALDAVNTLVEQMVSFDLLNDAAKPLDKMVVATIGQRWYGDRLMNNTVIVRQGLDGMVFNKLPDGTYNAPPGNAAKLIKNADGTYSYETLNRATMNFNAAGKVASYTHPSGVKASFTYSGNDLVQVQNSLGRTLTLTNVSGRITQVSDGTRNVGYSYDAAGNMTTFIDTLAKATTFQYDLPGRISKYFLPSSPGTAAITNAYDSLERLQTQTNANGKVWTYYFAGSRSEEVGPTGASRVSYLDGAGNVLRQVDPLGRVVTNTYDGQSRLIRRVLPEGNSVEYDYDDAPCAAQQRCTHNVKTVRQIPKSGSGLSTITTSATYESSFNQVASSTDALGLTTSYTYTAQGLPLSVTSPTDVSGVQPQTTYAYGTYAPAGWPAFYLQTSATSKINASNTVTKTTSYNAANKYVPQTVVNDAGTGKLNLTSSFTYDTVGNLTGIDGPRSDVADTATMAYDNERRLVQTIDALGKSAVIAYDEVGRPVRSAAQIGTQWLVSCKSYTPSGKLLKAWGPALTASYTTCPTAAAPVAVVDYAYDDLDRPLRTTQNLTTAEGGNRVSETVYNADDSVQSVKRAVGSSLAQTYLTYTYTGNGLPATIADANNRLTTVNYDGLDRKAKLSYPDKTTAGLSSATDYEQFGYDANGNVTNWRRRNGQTITQTWDNLGRLVARNYANTAANVQFAYDLRGLRLASQYANGTHTTTYSWDAAGRLLSTTAAARTLAYQYDAAGNRTRITWPDGFYASTDYDALNRPTVIRESGAASLAAYAYDDLSRRTTVTLGNGTTVQRGYDTQGAMASLKNFLSSASQEVQYGYSRNQAGQITATTWSNNLYQWGGAATGTRAYANNGLNQYTTVAGTTLAYDANGNLTTDDTGGTYTYDDDNRLTSATKPGISASLAYDAEGRLRQTVIGSNTLQLLNDGDRLVGEYDGAGNLLRRYVPGPGVDEPLVWYEGTGTANKNWLYADHLGSIVATANAAGASTGTYTYGPFGEPAGTTSAMRMRYTGQQYLAELGLYYYKARFYSPALGRFLQTDPIGYADDPNLYAYVGNDAVNRLDPSGLAATSAGGFGTETTSATRVTDVALNGSIQVASRFDANNVSTSLPNSSSSDGQKAAPPAAVANAPGGRYIPPTWQDFGVVADGVMTASMVTPIAPEVQAARLGLTKLISYGVETTAARAGPGLVEISMGAGRSASADFTALATNYGATVETITTKAGQVMQRFSSGEATVVLRDFGKSAGTTIQVTIKGIADGMKIRYP